MPRWRADHPPDLFQESLPYKKQFFLVGESGALSGPGSFRSQISALVAECMPSAQCTVTDAIPCGDQSNITRLFFTVSTLEEADSIVRHRCLLKPFRFTIFDSLSPTEDAAHQALWPRFLEARAQGKKAQFTRARLVVDGLRISPPSSA